LHAKYHLTLSIIYPFPARSCRKLSTSGIMLLAEDCVANRLAFLKIATVFSKPSLKFGALMSQKDVIRNVRTIRNCKEMLLSHFMICCTFDAIKNKIKLLLPSQKIKMAAYYVAILIFKLSSILLFLYIA
jgi:hypothetical protein